jgi:dTDP-4-amino-4,6-dideoxygalactose transaminase
VKVVFADITDELLLDFEDVKRKITPKTRAVVNVHLLGKYNKAPKLPVPIIGDSAQYVGKTEGELFTCYSFQATKIITTVDGGMLVCKRKKDYERARLLRWYGIDREAGKPNIEVNIKEAGYFFGMNNIDASMGIEGLKIVEKLKNQRKEFQDIYKKEIGGMGGSPYLIHTKNRKGLKKKLALKGIESGLVHMRNDTHTVFGGKKQNLPKMNRLEKTYLFLPCHNRMTIKDVKYICRTIKHD